MTNVYWVGLIAVLASFVTPIVQEDDPPLAEEGSDYPFTHELVLVDGLPWWVFKLLCIVVTPYLILIFTIIRMPTMFDVKGWESSNESDETIPGTSNTVSGDTAPDRDSVPSFAQYPAGVATRPGHV